MLYLNHILITVHLYGLRIVIQLIDLSSYKEKALRTINFQSHNSHSNPLFKKSFILKFSDKANLENTLFVSKSISNLLSSLFNNWFLFSADQHNYETSWSSLGNLHKPCKSSTYGKNCIVLSAINAWNNSQKLLKISLRHLSPNKIKKILSDAYFANYWNELSTFRYFKLMLDDFSNFASSISILTFSLCCCYFIMYILLSGLPLICWTKLLLLSTKLTIAWNSPYSI